MTDTLLLLLHFSFCPRINCFKAVKTVRTHTAHIPDEFSPRKM